MVTHNLNVLSIVGGDSDPQLVSIKTKVAKRRPDLVDGPGLAVPYSYRGFRLAYNHDLTAIGGGDLLSLDLRFMGPETGNLNLQLVHGAVGVIGPKLIFSMNSHELMRRPGFGISTY